LGRRLVERLERDVVGPLTALEAGHLDPHRLTLGVGCAGAKAPHFRQGFFGARQGSGRGRPTIVECPRSSAYLRAPPTRGPRAPAPRRPPARRPPRPARPSPAPGSRATATTWPRSPPSSGPRWW